MKPADSKVEPTYETTLRVIRKGVVVEEERDNGEQRNDN